MASSKKGKSAAKSRAAKKTPVRRQSVRAPAKTAAKRTGGAKRETATRLTAPRPSELRRLAVSASAMTREPDRKPAKKAEARPPRPPAVLPVPQSTFIF